MPKRQVPVLVGPTGVGKTSVAMALASHWPLTVISADSRQIYRGLDIGTAKPTAQMLSRVPHLGIDVVEPGERYSAGRFARDAARWIGDLPPERQPLVVGGTGFYVRALTDGLFREPPIDRGRRERVRAWLKTHEPVAAWAVRLDSGYTGGGRQRAARAVEVSLLTGQSLSWWQARARGEGTIAPWFVQLTVPRAILHQRIAERVDNMLTAGLVEEVRSLLANGVPPDAPGLDAVGYREVVRHLMGSLSEAELRDAIVVSTRRYAKRQETWFRHQLAGHEIGMLDATADPNALAADLDARWKERER